jgi:hypothetical protein
MGLNTSVQQHVEKQMLRYLNCYLLIFEESPKQLDRGEIIEILHQSNALVPERHGAMVNGNIEIFE